MLQVNWNVMIEVRNKTNKTKRIVTDLTLSSTLLSSHHGGRAWKTERQTLESAGKVRGEFVNPSRCREHFFEVIMKTVQIKGFDNSECPPKLSPCNRTEPSVQHSSHPSSIRQNATPHSRINRLSGDRKRLESKYGIRVFSLNSTNITEEISITFTGRY